MRLNKAVSSLEMKTIKRAPGVTVPDMAGVKKKSQMNAKRYKIGDAFKEFVWKTIPKIEERIEEDLLSDLYHKMDSQILKDELIQAYKRRRLSLEAKGFHEILPKPAGAPEGVILRPNIDVTYTDINMTSEEFVGLWALMKPQDYKTLFSKGSFGSYFANDISHSKVFSLACTPEGALIVNSLKNIQRSMKEPFDILGFMIANQNDIDFDVAISQFDNYIAVYRLLARDLRDQMVKHRGNSFVYNKLGDCFLFDSLLHVIMRHLGKDVDFRLAVAFPDSRKAIFESVMDQILDRTEEEFASLKEPGIWLSDLKYLVFDIHKHALKRRSATRTEEKKEFIIDLRKFQDHLKDLPAALQNFCVKDWLGAGSGVMLYGDGGSGKSGVLNFVTTWAWKNNWVILKVPSVFRLTQEELPFKRHEESRLYLQPDLAKEILEDFMTTNEHLLDKIPVNQSIYGFYNMTGCHDNEPIAVPNTYDDWTQTHFYDSDQFLLPGELQNNLNEQRFWKIRLREKLPNPKTLLELCQYAAKDPDYTTNVLAEVIEQLREQDQYPVLSSVDDYNYFYRRSVMPSFRYDNKKLKGKVPPYHLALCRMFMRMDGHRFKNGFKLVASSHFRLYKHTFNPDKIDHPKGFSIQLQGVKLDYFRNAVFHYTNLNLLKENIIDEALVQQYYVESQGNWEILTNFLHDRVNCYDLSDFKFDRRKFLKEESELNQ